MSSVCSVCNIRVNYRSDVLYIDCGKCNMSFHSQCVNLQKEDIAFFKDQLQSWMCSSCKSHEKSVRYDDDNTSMLNITHHAPSLKEPHDNIQSRSEDITEYLQKLSHMMTAISTSQENLTKKMDELKKQNESFLQKNIELEARIEIAESKHEDYERRISFLESTIDAKHQQEIENNIIIAGLPSNQDKDKLVMTIIQHLQAKVTADDIFDITTINEKTYDASAPRQLYLVKLKTLQSKMEILAKKKSYKELFTNDLNLNGRNNEIFIRHHLTPYQAKLYNAAKKIKTSGGFRFLWIKNNNIFLRQNDKSKVFKIRSTNDIEFIKKHTNKNNIKSTQSK